MSLVSPANHNNIMVGRLFVFFILLQIVKAFNQFHFEHATFDNQNLADFRFVKQDAWYGGQDAFPKGSALWLNPDPKEVQTRYEANIGKVVFKDPIQFKSSEYGMASFSTSFSFQITTTRAYPDCGSGMVFFIADYEKAPEKSYGRYFGMVGPNSTNAYRFFAIEFDTHISSTFYDVSGSHIGIDINSLQSLAVADTSPNSTNPEFYPKLFLYNNYTFTAWVEYNTSANLIQVWMTNASAVQRPSSPCLNLTYNLSNVFKDYMFVGFSATNNASEDGMEGHAIKSWNFTTQYPYSKKKTGLSSTMLAIIISVCAFVGACTVCGLLYYIICIRKKTVRPALISGSNPDLAAIRRYTLEQLRAATGGFRKRNKIGEGGYSIVYKGVMKDGSMIAVKKPKEGVKKEKTESDFLSEISIISKTRHRHLLPLQGWCYEQGEAILVYKYMRRGSLDTYLYGERKGTDLPRDTRYRILAGVASALDYLHSGLGECVLHRDVKAANVLLADNYEPMLGDFGLARQIEHSQVEEGGATMTAAGTTGHVAPEVVFLGRFSDKSDVYAYGVLALEVACGRPAIALSEKNPNEVMRLVQWVWELHLSNQLIEALDARMRVDINPDQEERWRGVLHFALMCCNSEPEKRPTMQQISQTLKGDNVLLTQPLPRSTSYVLPPNARDNWPAAASGSSSNLVQEASNSQNMQRPSR